MIPHAGYALRRYAPGDEEAVIALWLRSWQTAYPQIDFAARLPWWRKRWRHELVPLSEIAIAESAAAIAGFVTVDPRTRYLDQIVVATEWQGRGIAEILLAEARRVAPSGLDLHVNRDNARAIRFYQKHGFVTVSEDVNPRSGAPIFGMTWRP